MAFAYEQAVDVRDVDINTRKTACQILAKQAGTMALASA